MKIQAKIQIQIQKNGHLGLGAPPPLPLAVAAHTNISQRLNMVQFIFCLIFVAFSLFVSVFGVLMHLFHVVVACFYHPVGNDTMMINKIAHYVYFRSMQPPNVFCFDHLENQVDSVSYHWEIYVCGPPKTLGNIFILPIFKIQQYFHQITTGQYRFLIS